MKQTAAKIASVALHPLFMPFIGVAFLLFYGGYISLLPFQVKKVILLVVFANTLGLPLIMLPLFLRMGIIKSLAMESHRERVFPLIFTLIPYAFSFYFLYKLPIPTILATFMLGAAIAVFATTIISFWWKISIHMVGIGGFAGFLIGLSYRLSLDVLSLFIVVTLLSGILATARLMLNSHNQAQVYSGFGLGFVTLVSIMLL
ncbi:MAG: hypothetical protein JW783_01465 [Bacteroidales bacterium]|nr:hypothetical protein [Bacteroidales bacterium]MBN2749192.1 hypothetical protein [Bacteroidales bacterium]